MYPWRNFPTFFAFLDKSAGIAVCLCFLFLSTGGNVRKKTSKLLLYSDYSFRRIDSPPEDGDHEAHSAAVIVAKSEGTNLQSLYHYGRDMLAYNNGRSDS